MSDSTAMISIPHKTLGSLLIGLIVSSVIYGITCAQIVRYYQRYRSDSTRLKLAVGIVWLSETASQVMMIYALYYYLIRNRTNILALVDINWSLVVPFGTNGLAALIIQVIFARQVYIMSSKNMYITGFIYLMSIAQFVLAVVVMTKGLHSAYAIYDRFKVLAPPAFAITAANDILIALSLSYFLHTHKSGIARTNGIVNRLIILTINNGALSSILAFAALICLLTAPETMVSIAMNFLLGKAYTNTLLASLNWRQNSRDTLLQQNIPMMPRPRTASKSTFSGSDKSSQRNVYYWETNELDYENPPPSPRRALDQYLYVSGDKTDRADKCANSPNPG
ncbi:hypothetical protein ARMGADRAFT_1010693 [Armillaria gallica]|uniref:DUF6534 domain-containing protein n=1 Tax=Armillaria gallica TaxID=47427 RepID=A0A2H3DNW5_ARMGA|nr:hypothetical protein ARMGADRAFT_1010693 [Armillaria gallica]